jgi:transcriptional regulator with XRE-family HTH domain
MKKCFIIISESIQNIIVKKVLIMSQHFCDKFKILRQTRKLTQEQTAEIFHVAPQSIRRWETGVNYPDVETLPQIAIFFNTTVDDLLGTEQIKGEAKADEFIRDIHFALNSGKVSEAIEIGRNGVREYPLNHQLHLNLATALQTDDYEKNKDEIISVYERIINYCNTLDTILEAKFKLIRLYSHFNMKNKAQLVCDTLPSEIWYTRDACAKYTLEGDAWVKNQCLQIIRAKNLLTQSIGEYATKYCCDITLKIDRIQKMMQIEQIVGDLCNDHSHLTDTANNIYLAEILCEANEADKALICVESAVSHALCHINYMDVPESNVDNYFPHPTRRNMCQILLEDNLSKSIFDTLRDNERFKKCVETLKDNSGELK